MIHAGFPSLPLNPVLRHDVLLLAGTGFNLVLVLAGFFAKPGVSNLFITATASWEFGAFLGVIAAIVAVAAVISPLLRDRAGRC